MLNTIVTGAPGDLPPLLIAHGLFGSARNWGAVARRLSERRAVIAVDMRNHGESLRDPDHSYAAMASDLAEVIAAHGGAADVLGHSMGGKAAMVLALTEPERVGRLVVADIAPVAYGHSQAEYVEAMQATDLAGVTRRSQADPRLAEHVEEKALRAFFLQSLAIDERGASWRLNLEVLADQMPAIMGFPDVPGRFDGPALFLTGGASDYVDAAHWPAITERFPQAERETIGGAGHWLHAEAPREVAEAVAAFLDRDR
jgi:pimeloyl-ACP methyl ester carboxylesterase